MVLITNYGFLSDKEESDVVLNKKLQTEEEAKKDKDDRKLTERLPAHKQLKILETESRITSNEAGPAREKLETNQDANWQLMQTMQSRLLRTMGRRVIDSTVSSGRIRGSTREEMEGYKSMNKKLSTDERTDNQKRSLP